MAKRKKAPSARGSRPKPKPVPVKQKARQQRRMPGFWTHQEALVRAVMRTKGPVLELGIGDFSTPILHEICEAQRRYLRTVTQDVAWYERFKYLHRLDVHDVILLEGTGRTLQTWKSNEPFLTMCPGNKWSVVFVDQAPGVARVWSIELLKQMTDIFVVHDAEQAEHYRYTGIFPKFRYKRIYDRLTPHTATLSDRFRL